MMVLDISYATLASQSSKIFKDLNFRGQGQGLELQGRGQGHLKIGCRGSSRPRTFLEDNNTDFGVMILTVWGHVTSLVTWP